MSGEVRIAPELEKFRIDIWSTALATYQNEYKDLADAWAKLDGKAQGSATIAGVFLAAVFASARGEAIPTSGLDRLLVGVAIVLLVSAVIAAALALRVQAAEAGPLAREIERAVRDMEHVSRSHPDLNDLRVRFLRSQSNGWSECTKLFRARNTGKAAHVRMGVAGRGG